MTVTADDIRKLIRSGESCNLEMKACDASLPRSVWETYSAFANTRGGIILLGVTEHKEHIGANRFEITGVKNSNKIVTDFWNIVNNPQKVSLNFLVDSDVRIVEIDGVEVVYIQIPEVDYHKKPVFLNNDIQSGTYKRIHEGDRHVSIDELAFLMRDSSDDIDSQILECYSMDDIDLDCLTRYRRSFELRNMAHLYKDFDDKEFLRQIGGFRRDRRREIEGLTMAGLLMFGKRLPLIEVFPAFRLDYLDLIDIDASSSLKWNDRLTDDGRWDPNLYNYVTLVMRKLLFTLPSEGRLQGATRIDGGPLHEAVREAVVNAITYCDYKLNGVLRIDRRSDCIVLRNPGTLRISRERIYDGDFTLARNRTIQSMFRMIGYGDNIGSGFQKILSVWQRFGYRQPDLKEIEDVREVWLTLPLYADSQSNSHDRKMEKQQRERKIYEVPGANDALISQINSHVNLSVIQRDILRYMIDNPFSTIEEIAVSLCIKPEAVRYQRRLMSEWVRTEKSSSNKSGHWKVVFLR